MSEKRFTPTDRFRQFGVWCFDEEQNKYLDATSMVSMLNEQQDTINILLEELVNAQNQGYVVDFLHKNEHCSLIPKELEDE